MFVWKLVFLSIYPLSMREAVKEPFDWTEATLVLQYSWTNCLLYKIFYSSNSQLLLQCEIKLSVLWWGQKYCAILLGPFAILTPALPRPSLFLKPPRNPSYNNSISIKASPHAYPKKNEYMWKLGGTQDSVVYIKFDWWTCMPPAA